MNYDLSNKEDRKKFLRRANMLLKKQRTNVSLVDESKRTLNQNCYLHVLCRILALETGESEYYAKQVYFKELANSNIFVSITKDSITGKPARFLRSTTDLSVSEMAQAITNFIKWAAEEAKCELPEATIADDGSVVFKTQKDADAFHRAQIETSKLDG